MTGEISTRSQLAPCEFRWVGTALELDPVARRVTVGGTEIGLTSVEFALLLRLTEDVGKCCIYHDLLAGVWGTDCVGGTSYLHDYVRRLRRKLPGVPITSVRGVGYRLDIQPAITATDYQI